MDKYAECPLCCETFSKSIIESHASTCGLQQAQKKPTKRNISDIFKSPSHESHNKKMKTTETVFSPAVAAVNERPAVPVVAAVGGGSKGDRAGVPLAEILRPKDLSSYVGQENVVGEDSQLRKLLQADNVPSLILWGPPGCGKTSLANVISNKLKGKSRFVKMSACTCGVAEVREVVKQAKNELSMLKRRTILFMDEVHRFNKGQQDAFLPHIESGVITFIGATTENPSFSLNAALLSRCQVVVLEKLSPASLFLILQRGLQDYGVHLEEDQDHNENGTISGEAMRYLTNIVDGDARSAINTLQLVMDSREGESQINLQHVKEAAKRSHVLYDRSGDEHYFMASALQKSIRGSDDNAALYWLGRMLKGGEDPTFIARRLVRCASEDIGLGDPTALPLAVAAFQGCQLIGKPECDVLLAQATVHLARAKKSHEVYKALAAVYQSIDQGVLPPVPLHLRNSTSKMTRELGWGKGYTHNLNEVKNLTYLPPELKGSNFFKTS